MSRTRKRFIAGAICPECHDEDSLMLYEEAGQEHVECVTCAYKLSERDAQLKAEQQPTPANSELIGYFKP